MSILIANCPSCGGTLEFKAGTTVVIICPFCHSAVARTDRGLNDIGKVAEIVQSGSPLRIGLRGVWRGERFELTGRVQNRHELGGTWDEWYVSFANGWLGWLAEAQGKFYLTFHQKVSDSTPLPAFDELQPGRTIMIEVLNGQKYTLIVNEKGIAEAIAAEGEIPYAFVPNQRRLFADLSGVNNVFATLDFETSPPILFLGTEVTLKDLGLESLKPAERQKKQVSAININCPNCGGPLSLQAPDKTERVACPYCDSLLDANEGKLTWLQTLKPSPYEKEFALKIGMEAALGELTNNERMKIIGAMVRSVEIDGEKYFWHEYLLYNPMIGFRWLVHSDDHWNFVEPVNAAEINQSTEAIEKAIRNILPAEFEQATLVVTTSRSISFRGKSFQIFQDALARVEYVTGEFYWRVEQGETVRAVDYITPPLMLSCEMTEKEINWSLGHYLTVSEVQKAFGVDDLPKPSLFPPAPNQPFPYYFYLKWGIASLLLLIIIYVVLLPFRSTERIVLSQTITITPTNNQNPQPQILFSNPFELNGNQNVKIEASAPLQNSWIELDIDLVNTANDAVESVNIPISYYSGVEDGEQWSEGSNDNYALLSSLPAGNYILRIQATGDTGPNPIPVQLKVRQNTNTGTNFCCAFILLSIGPLITLYMRSRFEKSRWNQSMFYSD